MGRFARGHGLWFPVNLLAGMVLPGLQSLSVAELEQFRPGLLAIGVVIHAVMSAVIGLMYGVLLPTIPKHPRWQLVFGGVIIPLVWTGLSAGLMGIVNPILQRSVDWFWFALSQLVFGPAAAVCGRAIGEGDRCRPTRERPRRATPEEGRP